MTYMRFAKCLCQPIFLPHLFTLCALLPLSVSPDCHRELDRTLPSPVYFRLH
nr:MAG TPA_asm: hypothetical protein [Caudoviricetes sp.]